MWWRSMLGWKKGKAFSYVKLQLKVIVGRSFQWLKVTWERDFKWNSIWFDTTSNDNPVLWVSLYPDSFEASLYKQFLVDSKDVFKYRSKRFSLSTEMFSPAAGTGRTWSSVKSMRLFARRKYWIIYNINQSTNEPISYHSTIYYAPLMSAMSIFFPSFSNIVKSKKKNFFVKAKIPSW